MERLLSRHPGWGMEVLLLVLCWMLSTWAVALESGQEVVLPPPGEQNYTCSVPLVGDQAASVELTFDELVPIDNGLSGQIAIGGVLTLSEDTRTVLQLVGADTLEGTASLSMLSIQGAIRTRLSVPLTLSRVTGVDEGAGPIITDLSGYLPELTVEHSGMPVELVFGDAMTLALTAKNDQGQLASEPLGEFVVPCIETVAPGEPTPPPPPAGAFRVEPRSLDFGSLAVGEQARASVVLTNTEQFATALPYINIPNGSPFIPVSHCPAQLQPGESCSLDVFFNPFQEQQREETLAFRSGTTDVKVQLAGQAMNRQESAYAYSRTDHYECSVFLFDTDVRMTASIAEPQGADAGNDGPLAFAGQVQLQGTFLGALGDVLDAASLQGSGQMQFETEVGAFATVFEIPPTPLFEGMPTLNITHSDSIAAEHFQQGLRLNRGTVRMDLSLLKADGTPAVPAYESFEVSCEASDYFFQDGPVRLKPQRMDFGYVLVGEQAVRTVVLESRFPDIDVLGITVSGPDEGKFSHVEQCDPTVSESRLCAIDVIYEPGVPGTDEAVLRVTVAPEDSSDPTAYEIPMTGIGVRSLAPELVTNPEVIDFGAVEPGASAEQRFTVSNSGDVATAIRDVALEGAGASSFQQSHRCFVLGAGEHCEVKVTVTATESGFEEAYVRIVPEHLDAKSIRVPLRAELQSEQCVPVGFGVTGSSDLNGPVELDGALYATRDCEQQRFSGLLELAPTRATVPVLGLIWSGWSGTAHLEFEAVGKATGALAEDGSLATAESRFHIRVPRITASVFGRNRVIGGGSRCRTVEPVTLSLSGTGQELTGQLAVGRFENCGLTTGLLNRYLSGSSGETRLTLSSAD